MSQKEQDQFHAHLDVCVRCRERPMDLCPVGGMLLRLAAQQPVHFGIDWASGQDWTAEFKPNAEGEA